MKRSGFLQNKCPKCGGNLYIDNDEFGWYEQCLQCGLQSDLREVAKTQIKTKTGSK